MNLNQPIKLQFCILDCEVVFLFLEDVAFHWEGLPRAASCSGPAGLLWWAPLPISEAVWCREPDFLSPGWEGTAFPRRAEQLPGTLGVLSALTGAALRSRSWWHGIARNLGTI